MISAPLYRAGGDGEDSVELPSDPFDGQVHEAAVHQAVKAQLANRRQGNASAKSRGQVSGGGSKAWRQKGTGRARQGSIRAPHWRGGGAAFGPSTRSYRQRVPAKVRGLARRSAFNRRALDGRLRVVEDFGLEGPSTRGVVKLLGELGLEGSRRTLILTDGVDRLVHLSTRNLPSVEVMPYSEVSVYDILRADTLIIQAAALHDASAREPAGDTEVADHG